MSGGMTPGGMQPEGMQPNGMQPAGSDPQFFGPIIGLRAAPNTGTHQFDLSGHFLGATSYSISPAVESGWSFNTSTCVLTIDTDAIGAFGPYTITSGSVSSNAFSVTVAARKDVASPQYRRTLVEYDGQVLEVANQAQAVELLESIRHAQAQKARQAELEALSAYEDQLSRQAQEAVQAEVERQALRAWLAEQGVKETHDSLVDSLAHSLASPRTTIKIPKGGATHVLSASTGIRQLARRA